MRIFVGREPQSELAFAFDEGACDIAPLPRFAVALLDCPDGQRAHRGTGLLHALAQFVVRGPDCRRSIMLLAQKFAEDG
jgi:hypothetical protein